MVKFSETQTFACLNGLITSKRNYTIQSRSIKKNNFETAKWKVSNFEKKNIFYSRYFSQNKNFA